MNVKMPDANVPFILQSGAVNPPWYMFLAALFQLVGGPPVVNNIGANGSSDVEINESIDEATSSVQSQEFNLSLERLLWTNTEDIPSQNLQNEDFISIDVADPLYTVSSSLTFAGQSTRIYGEFSNLTPLQRCLFQTYVGNGNTLLGAIPAGTGNSSSFSFFNTFNPNNSGWIGVIAGASGHTIQCDKTGAASMLPLNFVINGTTQVTLPLAGGQQINNGNLNFTSMGQLITGDMSNVTNSNRLFFQTSINGGLTSLGVMPGNGGPSSNITLYGSPTVNNSNWGAMIANPAGINIQSGQSGTGVSQPINFIVNGNTACIMDTSGIMNFGTFTTAAVSQTGYITIKDISGNTRRLLVG